jgi:hypothetical protein
VALQSHSAANSSYVIQIWGMFLTAFFDAGRLGANRKGGVAAVRSTLSCPPAMDIGVDD